MAAIDARAEALHWALDEVRRQAFLDQVHVAVEFAPVPAQGPQGVRPAPGWHLVLSVPNPLVGEGPLWHLGTVGSPVPLEAAVRHEAAEGLRQLRDLRASKLSGLNGRGKPAGVPG